MSLKIVLFSILIFVQIIDGRIPYKVFKRSEKIVQPVYDALPEQEKSPFISYFLMKNYWSINMESLPIKLLNASLINDYPFMPVLYKKFEKLNIPREFPKVLTEWVMTDYHVEQEQIPILARGEVVCPTNLDHCIDIGDFGPNCCPM